MLKKVLFSWLLTSVLFINGFSIITVYAADIPADAIVHNGHSYKIYDSNLSWANAKTYCENLGGHLVTITSKEEQDFIIETFLQNSSTYYWIGGYKDDNSEWKWVTGEPFIYTAWNQGEPNNQGGAETRININYRGTKGWNDATPGDRIGFICEWDEMNTLSNPTEQFNSTKHRYAFYDTASSWGEAKTYCESLGGHIATLTSKEENDYVYKLLIESGYTSAYFGLSDREQEGVWKWVTGEPFIFSNWHSGEPNAEYSNEDYAMFYWKYTDGTWNDGDFGGRTAQGGTVFICEWDSEMTHAPISTTTTEYIYDIRDLSESINLPIDKLTGITDTASAITAIQSATSGLTPDQKQSTTGIDLLTLFAEEAIAQASSQTVTGGDIVIDSGSVSALQSAARSTKTAAEQALAPEGITTAREMSSGIKFKTQTTGSVKITVDPSASSTTADNVRVETQGYSISLSSEAIKENTADGSLVITITESGVSARDNATIMLKAPGRTSIGMMTASARGIASTDIVAANPPTSTKTYAVNFNKPVTQNVKVSLPPSSGDPKYQAVTNSKNEPVGGKYNPATNKIDVKINTSDTYTVKENKKDFADISNKSNEMQNAIRVLASKGIINGTSATAFSPDSPITRAEIAGLIMRAISKYNANEDGGFSDVKRADWFFGAAGSAKKHGIMSGTSATMFSPRTNIPKDQIVAVSARVLKSEMKYKSPSNADGLLSTYTDSGSIPSWGKGDIALATRENLVVKRTDGRFNPSATMTRGDAAIILYRMFMKIW